MVGYIYSFRIAWELESIARKYGYKTVSDFIRGAIVEYIRNHNGVDDKMVEEMGEIEELYLKYVMVKRLLGTQREKKRLEKMMVSEHLDNEVIRYMMGLLDRKEKKEKELIKKIMDGDRYEK